MAEKRKMSKLLETKWFGLFIGLAVFLLMTWFTFGTVLISNLEMGVLDFNFRLKNTMTGNRIQEGVSVVQSNPRISRDLLLVGIDDKALDKYGKWPFPRSRHATLINNMARIKDQNQRERALFLDIFFIDPDPAAEDDALVVGSIKANERVFLETTLSVEEVPTGTEEEYFGRQDVLNENVGRITNIKGDWTTVTTFRGLLPPLKPYGRAPRGSGHANFFEDDDQVYRRQPLVAKVSRLIAEIPLEELTVEEPVDHAGFERMAWMDKNGFFHNLPYPLTADKLNALKKTVERDSPPRAEDTDGDGKPDKNTFIIRKYKDTFLPSITLALATEYFHRKLSDLEVTVGKSIRIPSPEVFNPQTGEWETYRTTVKEPVVDKDGNVVSEGVYKEVAEIQIPIDAQGNMLINFMGPPSSANPGENQTFPVRSYAGYADSSANQGQDPSKWPTTKALPNKIVMMGPFAKGVAADEKPTPFGLMFGVEIHANALNTILKQNFLYPVADWVTLLILFVMILGTSFMVSRLSTIWSMVVTVAVILIYFFTGLVIFELSDLIMIITAPIIGTFLCFIAVVAYRTMTEEKDKRRIRDMFGRYVSPAVVEEILQNPPELGGVDKDITVFFSDIRGFTTLSESMTPQELVNHLNLYLTAMTDIILEYTGTLDKYVGDEVMAFWGAPLPQPDHALMACKCALKQIEVLHQMNTQWPPERRINIGIGLNTGIMTVGNMGSLGRMNYTLMGDNCNLGARLEGTNKQYYTTIIISEFTYAHVKDKVTVRELDNIRVKGKNKPVLIYELIDVIEGLEPPAKIVEKGKGRAVPAKA